MLRVARCGYHCVSEHTTRNIKVAVLGAAGRVGQLASLLLKQSRLVQQLAVVDVEPGIKDVFIDLSRLDTRAHVEMYNGLQDVPLAMKDANVVLICAGATRRGDMTSQDLLLANVDLLFNLANQFALSSPRAMLAILTQPTDSLVPLVCEVLRERGVLDRSRVFGVTAVDVLRANTLVAREVGQDPESFIVPVVGGHSRTTTVPVLSQTKPCVRLPQVIQDDLSNRVRSAADDVYRLNDCQETAGIAPAVAAVRFVKSLIRGIHGEPAVLECAFVATKSVPGIDYMSLPLELGEFGVRRDFGLPRMSVTENNQLQEAMTELKKNIARGECFASKMLNRPQPKKFCAKE